MLLFQIEFSYNYVINRSIVKSPFEVIYGRAPRHYLDLPKPEHHYRVKRRKTLQIQW
jgi:hypothetical protein